MPSSKGLFFSDVKSDVAHVLINTVDKNKNKYTVRQYSDAHKARSIQDIIRQPATDDFIKYVENGLLPECPKMREKILNLPSSMADTVHRSMLQTDKYNETQKPKDMGKDTGGKNNTCRSSTSNMTKIKWAKRG